MRKKYDAVVVTGKYTDGQGQEKKRYKNVGVVMESDKGLFMLLEATFNPAGIKEPGKESILVSFFEPKGRDATSHDQAKQSGYQAETVDDEIPF